jgi:ectoine hydroxylase-related dioxygenase (phytanoyl-CoA dioxygenase family)
MFLSMNKHLIFSNFRNFRNISKYITDKNSLSRPWVESPFFEQLLKNNKHTEEEKKKLVQFNKNGYLIIDLKLNNDEINNVINDIYKFTNKSMKEYNNKIPDAVEYKESKNKKSTIQSNVTTYTSSPRLFEGWKESNYIKNLTLNKEIINNLKLLYNKEPFPFSTINFIKGSNQPFHSDTIHFNSIPNYWMTGVWVALEDVDEDNGALKIIPESHKWDCFHYEDLNLQHPDKIENGEEINYREYESFLDNLIKVNNSKQKVVELKKGQAIIWAANLLHGGLAIKDSNRTRLSQAIHYFFDDCERYYHPMFSQPSKGIYANKWCTTNNNIKHFNN